MCVGIHSSDSARSGSGLQQTVGWSAVDAQEHPERVHAPPINPAAIHSPATAASNAGTVVTTPTRKYVTAEICIPRRRTITSQSMVANEPIVVKFGPKIDAYDHCCRQVAALDAGRQPSER
jgi:hypothetical protein